jgi:3-dehydrosphinganine reductase
VAPRAARGSRGHAPVGGARLTTPPQSRHAIVTGGASGIGLALVRRLTAAGTRVSVLDVDDEGLQRLARDPALAGRVAAEPGDVGERMHAYAAVAACAERHGTPDLLVTCAGVVRPGYFRTLDDAEFEREMHINYFGTLWPIRAVVPAMAEAGRGSIVGISSLAGLLGYFGYTAYGPTKYAVAGLCDTLRIELKPLGIFVGCVYPPDVDTPMLAAEEPLQPPEARAMNKGLPALSPDVVVDAIFDGIAHGRTRIFPGRGTHAVERAVHLAPSLVDRYVDHAVSGEARPDEPTAPER